MKHEPKQDKEIKEHCHPKSEAITELNLKNLKEKNAVFPVNVNGNLFYKFNIYPGEITDFFRLCKILDWLELLNVRDDVIRNYPAKSLRIFYGNIE